MLLQYMNNNMGGNVEFFDVQSAHSSCIKNVMKCTSYVSPERFS